MLQVDGRISFAQIARQLGVAEKTIARKVDQLLEQRAIVITTVTDPDVLGYHAAALVGVTCDSTRPLADVLGDVGQSRAANYAVVSTGRYDVLVEVISRTESDMMTAIDADVRALPGVQGAEIFPYLRAPYQEPGWDQAARKAQTPSSGVRPAGVIGDIDRKIIAALTTNGRMPFAAIGNHLGISESQVRKRVHQLSSSGVIKILALTNPRSLGFMITAFLAIRAAPGKAVLTIAEELAALPSISYLIVCAGRFDIFAEVVCRDRQALLTLIDGDVRSLNGVAHLEVLFCIDLHYRRVDPVPSS
jgi:Lrp/AsnC family transcriptional regulator for asnA, asnC and gidA